MDLLWRIFLLLVGCAEAKNLTEVQVELGQNVTLNCSLSASNMYWYVEVTSQVQGRIGRTFSNNAEDNEYSVSTVTTKYSMMGNSLMITNITAEDCRLYFCGKRQNSKIQFEETFRLVSGLRRQPFIPNDRVLPDVAIALTANVSDPVHQRQLIMYASFGLNGLLFLVVTGLVFTSLSLKTKKRQTNEPPPFTGETTETLETAQYEEIQLPTYRTPPSAAPPPIYYKAQLPRSTLPPQ